ncbi:peptidase-C39 like family protein [Pontibacter cellulosilyticus]|uniref:Peptidase-C39 like family protein n=1 Tax=Pontibacter cellulosilyticus TaxID=1720253 RepID=A0A923N3U7_9BACT|nr:peptidase-C39 like family protein [Pontibacter cellulosilyticus]MBC5991669.1 peptidase-C39 like family protein [Pontibacter cellulosilyticus]
MIPIKIHTQPDDSTCGPTSLHAVYRYFKDPITLSDVIKEVPYLDEGGTLEVLLACHALKRGYRASIYTYNLHIFDPTWIGLSNEEIILKLEQQLEYKKGSKFRRATMAYIEFLRLGGELKSRDLTKSLLIEYFEQGIPLLTGLSATYLYRSAREFADEAGNSVYDDVQGYPMGHFVVLCGFGEDMKSIVVADPYQENPYFKDNYYEVKASHLINSIMLGMATFDANLLAIQPSITEPDQV